MVNVVLLPSISAWPRISAAGMCIPANIFSPNLISTEDVIPICDGLIVVVVGKFAFTNY